jgi:hypothetical protein
VRSFLLLNLLLENADIVGLGDPDSEDLAFWVFIEKQAVECECRHRRKGACSVQGKRATPLRAVLCLLDGGSCDGTRIIVRCVATTCSDWRASSRLSINFQV